MSFRYGILLLVGLSFMFLGCIEGTRPISSPTPHEIPPIIATQVTQDSSAQAAVSVTPSVKETATPAPIASPNMASPGIRDSNLTSPEPNNLPTPTASGVNGSFLGLWKVEKYDLFDALANVDTPLGKDAHGFVPYFEFTTDGRICVSWDSVAESPICQKYLRYTSNETHISWSDFKVISNGSKTSPYFSVTSVAHYWWQIANDKLVLTFELFRYDGALMFRYTYVCSKNFPAR